MSTEEKANFSNSWDNVYASKAESELSWFEEKPALSLKLIRQFAADPHSRLVDVGGGSSRLVDHLLMAGYDQPCVLDISAGALAIAKQRLGDAATLVEWVQSDILSWRPAQKFDLWHDRAANHFLLSLEQRESYVHLAASTLRANGILLLQTFALDGPLSCSRREVYRTDAAMIETEFGRAFQPVESIRHTHTTPDGRQQRFNAYVLKRIPD